jgi:hypothetical protein
MVASLQYKGFKRVANFGIIAEGGTAAENVMPAKDVLEALSALANIARRTTLLCMGRPSPSPEDLGDYNVMVSPSAGGSFLMDVAVGVGTNISANLITPTSAEEEGNSRRACRKPCRKQLT